jgi:UDP-N-acetylglucosamine--N-acetylmuramyl-(pentapeptide) pyrophosphoryl-undecaprenol N-acetylglucosamine transferase
LNKYIVVTGGGTGGHLSVAKALIKELVELKYKIIYIGSTKGQDKQWFENEPMIEKTYFLDTYGVVNQKGIKKVLSLFQIFRSMIQCIKIFYEYDVAKVISVGGFSAAAASFASIVTAKKLYIHEQNAHMGKLNQITSRFSRQLFSSYDTNSSIADYPINQEFFRYSKIKKNINSIIFLGGSQGAMAINNFAIKVAPLLSNKNIKIIHQTGSNDLERIKKEYEKLNIKADVFDFSKELILKMKDADFAVSRSGASTLWELCALNTPALFIPYPFAAGNHQYHNAKFLIDQNMGYICEEKNLDTLDFEKILNDTMQLKSENLEKSIKEDGAKRIARFVFED